MFSLATAIKPEAKDIFERAQYNIYITKNTMTSF
jgi:hypothetical protein